MGPAICVDRLFIIFCKFSNALYVFYALPNQFSQGFGIFCRTVDGSHVETSTAVHRLLTYVSYPTYSVKCIETETTSR
jgi:hypothetical protein